VNRENFVVLESWGAQEVMKGKRRKVRARTDRLEQFLGDLQIIKKTSKLIAGPSAGIKRRGRTQGGQRRKQTLKRGSLGTTVAPSLRKSSVLDANKGGDLGTSRTKTSKGCSSTG